MGILDKVKGLVTGENGVEDVVKDVAGEVAGNLDIGSMLGGLLNGGNLSLDTLGKALIPAAKQIGGDAAATEVTNTMGNLTQTVQSGVSETSLVTGVIKFLQNSGVSLDTLLGLLKKIPVDPADIIKFLGLGQ